MMLSEEEELRLDTILKAINVRPMFEDLHYIKWLATRLKELNEFIKLLEAKPDRAESLEDRAIVNKAKQLLMDVHGLKEGKAYRFIINTSMNTKRSKVSIAKQIIEELDLT